MEMRDYLEIGAKKAGGLTALGTILGQGQTCMSAAKAHKRPLPTDAVVKLADYIGADLRAVISANELVTEKKEEKRHYWNQFVEHARAAVIVGTIAGAINFWTPSPAEAAPVIGSEPERFVLCKPRNLKKRKLYRLLESILETLSSLFTMRTPEPEPV